MRRAVVFGRRLLSTKAPRPAPAPRGDGGSKSKAVAAAATDKAAPPAEKDASQEEWTPVLHEASGQIYWWNKNTGAKPKQRGGGEGGRLGGVRGIGRMSAGRCRAGGREGGRKP